MQSSKNNTKGSYELLKISLDKISENFNVRDFIMKLNVHVVTWNHLYNGIPLRLLKNLYVSFGIPFDPKRYYKDGAHTNIAVAKVAGYTEDIVHNYERRLEAIWGRSVNRVHIREIEDGGVRRSMTWRQFFLALGLHTEHEMAQAGFGAYWSGSERIVPDKGDLRDYWIEISSDRDFLGATPFYVHIRDPVRRLCHKMLACTISGQGQGPEKVTGVDLFYLRTIYRGTANVPYLLAQYMFKHAEGRKSGARLFGGYFIGRLANYFGLVSDEGLRGLTIISRELPVIDLHELAKLNICGRFGDTWDWADLEPTQALHPPPAPQTRTMSQRIERIKEEMRELRQSVTGLRGVIESSITEQAKVSTLMTSCMTQLMDANVRTYQAFDSTLVGSSRLPYQRRTRRKTDDANTSAAPHSDDQLDP
ncbi:hypothetical protein Tco_0750112 [Tanacetum coccineum]|uniref:Aminotransferase-like plant mobile domain-containing protein n=1 Tax=Tanacetum coccineum TaxID=301880 RepID=A0ABQ4Z1E0_9ASTR